MPVIRVCPNTCPEVILSKLHSPSDKWRILGVCLFISILPGNALKTHVDIARLAKIYIILGECLLISSLPVKALKTHVDFARLAEI